MLDRLEWTHFPRNTCCRVQVHVFLFSSDVSFPCICTYIFCSSKLKIAFCMLKEWTLSMCLPKQSQAQLPIQIQNQLGSIRSMLKPVGAVSLGGTMSKGPWTKVNQKWDVFTVSAQSWARDMQGHCLACCVWQFIHTLQLVSLFFRPRWHKTRFYWSGLDPAEGLSNHVNLHCSLWCLIWRDVTTEKNRLIKGTDFLSHTYLIVIRPQKVWAFMKQHEAQTEDTDWWRDAAWCGTCWNCQRCQSECEEKQRRFFECTLETGPQLIWFDKWCLTLAGLRHSDGDCKGTVTGSYRSILDWVWLGGTGSVRSISAFRAVVAQARMGAESISRGFRWGGLYFLAGELFWVTMCARQFSKVH